VSGDGPGRRIAAHRRSERLRALLARPSSAGTAILAAEVLGPPASLRVGTVVSAPWSGWDG
jgi:hypothetical protein